MNNYFIKRSLLTLSVLLAVLSASAVNTRQPLQKMVTAVRASYTESGHTLAALNDGSLTTSSSYWSGYRDADNLGLWEYVEYSWSTTCSINRAVVNWVALDGKLDYPAEAYLATWDGHQWTKAYDLVSPNASGVSPNTGLTLETNRLRLYMLRIVRAYTLCRNAFFIG